MSINNILFMRKYKNEILFFIINFDSQLVDVAINVPSHAFDFLQIPQMESYQAIDLMTGAKEESAYYLINRQMFRSEVITEKF